MFNIASIQFKATLVPFLKFSYHFGEDGLLGCSILFNYMVIWSFQEFFGTLFSMSFCLYSISNMFGLD